MKIIGISGTNGSGKDSLGAMLAERHGWMFVPFTDILRDELRARGVAVERENMRALGNEWRRNYGRAFLVDKSLDLYKLAAGQHNGLVVTSIRNTGEADRIHELGGEIVWVDADPGVRYERINSRARGAEDKKTFEQFLAEEQAEMHLEGEDKATLSMAEVKAKADIFINNNGNNIEAFKDDAEKALKEFL